MSTSLACDSDGGGNEVVAQAVQEVGGGLVDDGDLYPAVVALAPPGGSIESRFCSGTLVTPNRVVSAAHCFTPNSVSGPLDVLVVTHPGGVKTVTTYTHRSTFASGVQTNVVRTFTTPGPTGGDSNGDIAVITLDSPVPDVTPMEAATPDDPCPRTTEFIANLVGFGRTGAAPPSCGLVNPDDRSWATSTGWEYDDPGVYSNSWNLTSYQGGLFRDSGGALLQGSRLCGVHSRHSGVTCAGPLGAIAANSYAAAIDDWDLTATTSVPLTEQESVISYVDPRTGEPGLAPEGCSMTTPEWTSNHLCVATSEVFDGGVKVGRQFLLPPTSSGAPLASWTSTATFPSGCSTDLLGAGDSAGKGWVRDLVSGNEYPLEASPGIAWPPVIHEDIALFRRWWGDGTYIRLDAWIWKRPNVMEPLIEAPGGEMVYDVRTDGATLVWVQAKSESVLDRAPGELWTSPFSTTSSALQPSKRRTTPPLTVAETQKGVGGGYYALIEQPFPEGNENWKLHMYRLSDARHWQVVLPGALRPVEVVHVDAEEVWVRAHTMKVADMTLIRRRIDQLGPGD